ncbi:hypothetical protein [Hymenobacter psoromatis]|uniref:hypothetical protein n=1 Tax=Hymenobacter psoromatis TaxID=1484116 RepID=UPI001CC025F3|nr:hypothetical protein [Hymenobacter psoromatis]
MSLGNALAPGVVRGFLRAGRVLDGCSSVLLLGTLVLAASAEQPLAVGAALLAFGLAGLQKYLAWRVALDAELFALLSPQPPPLADFDAALAAFLGRDPGLAGRSLAAASR